MGVANVRAWQCINIKNTRFSALVNWPVFQRKLCMLQCTLTFDDCKTSVRCIYLFISNTTYTSCYCFFFSIFTGFFPFSSDPSESFLIVVCQLNLSFWLKFEHTIPSPATDNTKRIYWSCLQHQRMPQHWTINNAWTFMQILCDISKHHCNLVLSSGIFYVKFLHFTVFSFFLPLLGDMRYRLICASKCACHLRRFIFYDAVKMCRHNWYSYNWLRN